MLLPMNNNDDRWAVVTATVLACMDDLNMRQADLVRESELSDATVRSFMTGEFRAKPSRHTIRKLEDGLLWRPRTVERILDGEDPEQVIGEAALPRRRQLVDEILSRLDGLEAAVARLDSDQRVLGQITRDELLELPIPGDPSGDVPRAIEARPKTPPPNTGS